MLAFPDTSFLCALYRQQENSSVAAAYFEAMSEPLFVSNLLLYEFRQSLRFQVWIHGKDKKKGFSKKDCESVLADLQTDLDSGVLVVVRPEWPDVHRLADILSARHTMVSGHRSFDILHVATALHMSAHEFLTFDKNQSELARAEKLKVKP